jgi:hypothetical protein
MRWIVAVLLMSCWLGTAASAESCSKSLNFILSGFAGDLPLPGADYRNLYKSCAQALTMTDVKDAYILKDGGIAVVPARDSITATAGTLAAFCEAYPSGRLRFLTHKEIRRGLTTGSVVMMPSTGSGSCRHIRGEE